MDVYRIGAKFFLKDPASLQLRDLVPVFHTWIQTQAIPDHLLIDVHDYSHIQWGPGILLVGHEGNFSMDLDHGRPGLFYYRKRALDGDPERRLSAVLRAALYACRMLEEDATLGGKLQFRTDEFWLAANDRLLAPNNADTSAALQRVVSAVLRRLDGYAQFNLTPTAGDPKERFSMRVDIGQSVGIADLLTRLSES
jgi:hypothetical protein